MSANSHQVDMEEATVDELLSALEEHGRIVLGREPADKTMMLRERDGTYYCDTSIKLYTFDCPECLGQYLAGLGIPASDTERAPL